MRTAVLSGMGLAVASRGRFSPELASGKVEAVLTDWTLPALDPWAVFPSGRLVTARARAFVEFVEEALARA
jgi:DNA-binding transcriptional LysR family regulator